jgi:hypothetical protein
MNNEHKPNSAPAWPRRLFLAFLPLAALFVLAFVLVRPASAAQVFTFDYPVSGVAYNACNGEYVTFSGVDHYILNVTYGANGRVNASDHDNIHMAGVGDQGNTYVGSSEQNTVFDLKIGAEVTSVADTLLISQ